MAQDPFAHRLVRRADLSVEPRWGCVVLIFEDGLVLLEKTNVLGNSSAPLQGSNLFG